MIGDRRLRPRVRGASPRWHDALGQPDYAWELARTDYARCVEQCLHVPMEWCAPPENVEKMRWLWEGQLGNLQGGPVQPPPHLAARE